MNLRANCVLDTWNQLYFWLFIHLSGFFASITISKRLGIGSSEKALENDKQNKGGKNLTYAETVWRKE